MSAALIAFLFAAGVGGWVYSKVNHRAGGENYKSSLMAAGFSAGIAFIVFYTLFKMAFPH